jgi:protein TonB
VPADDAAPRSLARKPDNPGLIAAWTGPWTVSLCLHGALAAWLCAHPLPTPVTADWAVSVSMPMQASFRAQPEPVELEPVPPPPAVVAEEPTFEPLELEPLPVVEPMLSPAGPAPVPPAKPMEPKAPSACELATRYETTHGSAPAVPLATPALGTEVITRRGGYVEPSPLAGTNEPPVYPFVAWRRGIEGTVVVLLEVNRDGNVTAARLLESSGNQSLDDAAVKKLATWHFTPATRDGVAVAAVLRQSVVFRLTDRH